MSSYIVYDVNTKTVIDGQNYNEISLVASTTKILTAIVAIENMPLYDKIKIIKEDTQIEGSKVYLKENEHYTVLDLLYGLMLRSGNDCANALARSYKYGYNSFIELMNNKCKEINMTSSVFQNPSGLDGDTENKSTSYDMALLMSYAMENEYFYKISSTHEIKIKSFEGTTFYLQNKDKLLFSDDRFIAGKTGYTKSSKRVLVNYASYLGKNIVIVTINDSNDWQNHKKYLDKALNMKLYTVLNKGIYNINGHDFSLEIDDDIKCYYANNISFYLDIKEEILYLYYNDNKILSKEVKIIYN